MNLLLNIYPWYFVRFTCKVLKLYLLVKIPEKLKNKDLRNMAAFLAVFLADT